MVLNRSIDNVIVLAATQYTSNTTVDAVTLTNMKDFHSISFLCRFATGESTAGDLLQVFFQRSGNNGITWDDIGATTDVAESAISTTLYEWVNITSNIEPGNSDDVYTEAADALTAGTTKDVPWGDSIRVRVKQTEGSSLDITLTIWGIFKSN